MSGRYLLARGAHRFKKYLPGRYVTNLEGAEELLKRKKNGVIAVVALFVVSPLPSAQLFIAAGPLGRRGVSPSRSDCSSRFASFH